MAINKLLHVCTSWFSSFQNLCTCNLEVPGLPHHNFTLEKGKQDPKYREFIKGRVLGRLTSSKTEFACLLHQYLYGIVLVLSFRSLLKSWAYFHLKKPWIEFSAWMSNSNQGSSKPFFFLKPKLYSINKSYVKFCRHPKKNQMGELTFCVQNYFKVLLY